MDPILLAQVARAQTPIVALGTSTVRRELDCTEPQGCDCRRGQGLKGLGGGGAFRVGAQVMLIQTDPRPECQDLGLFHVISGGDDSFKAPSLE